MTKDDILRMLRNGDIQLFITSSFDEKSTSPIVLELSARDGRVLTEEFLDAFRQHQGDIYILLEQNDVSVCLSPDEHRDSYRYTETPRGWMAFICDACAAIRQTQALTQAPSPPGTNRIDFRPPEDS